MTLFWVGYCAGILTWLALGGIGIALVWWCGRGYDETDERRAVAEAERCVRRRSGR